MRSTTGNLGLEKMSSRNGREEAAGREGNGMGTSAQGNHQAQVATGSGTVQQQSAAGTGQPDKAYDKLTGWTTSEPPIASSVQSSTTYLGKHQNESLQRKSSTGLQAATPFAFFAAYQRGHCISYLSSRHVACLPLSRPPVPSAAQRPGRRSDSDGDPSYERMT